MGIALAAVATSAMLGTYLHRYSVMWLPALILSLGGIFTAPLGKWLAIHTNEIVLTISFSALSLYIAYSMWKKSAFPVQSSTKVKLNDENSTPSSSINDQYLALTTGGLGIGLASGLFGVRGGFLIILFLMGLSAISVISLVGFISHAIFTQGKAIEQPMNILIPLIASSLLAMLISKKICNKLSDKTLKIGFAILLLIVTIIMLIKQVTIL